MDSIILALCMVILGGLTVVGVMELYYSVVNKKPVLVLKAMGFFFLGCLLAGVIYFISTSFPSSLLSFVESPISLLSYYLVLALVFSLIALLESMPKKTEEAPEKSEDIPSDLDGRVEYWHTHDTGNTLQEFLGMTDSEYEKWGRGEHTPAAEDNEKEDK